MSTPIAIVYLHELKLTRRRLDSRQRKKQHTERLEDEKKHFTAILGDMEEEMADLKAKMDQLLREKQSYQEYIESMAMEKEELIRAHTIETGELRKKVGILTGHVQRLEGAAMCSDASGHPGFASAFDEMDGMAMGGPWDNMGFLGEYPIKEEPEPELHLVPASQKPEVQMRTRTEVEKPAASEGGVLFMLFLVGAFVLSNRSAPSIPPVSEDVRAEAATLLDNVFKDAGVNEPANVVQAGAPRPSGAQWAEHAALPVADATSMRGMAPSMLGQLGDSLAQPTEDQTNEQIFSLSAAQYNGVHSQDFLQHAPERSTSQGRRNLAEALASMRQTNKESVAEVYTRSLLWDQIPSEVVKNFAKMVAECNNAQQTEQQQ